MCRYGRYVNIFSIIIVGVTTQLLWIFQYINVPKYLFSVPNLCISSFFYYLIIIKHETMKLFHKNTKNCFVLKFCLYANECLKMKFFVRCHIAIKLHNVHAGDNLMFVYQCISVFVYLNL